MKLGTHEITGGIVVSTFIYRNKMITIWKNKDGTSCVRKERYIKDGKLYNVHTNNSGERTIRIFERVQGKSDILYSIANVGGLYLKFW